MTQIPEGWRDATRTEQEAAIDAEKKRAGIYNGMTTAGLRRQFGDDNVRHLRGRGWIIRR